MSKLTLRDYLAVLITKLQNPGQTQPLWLCTDGHVKRKALKKADKSFEDWKEHELEMEKRRKSRD